MIDKDNVLLRMRDYIPDEAYKNNIFTGSYLDMVLSSAGGLAKGDKSLFYGGPGTGKSTILACALADIQIVDPTKRVLYVSNEMRIRHMADFAKRFEKIKDIPILFLGKNGESGTALRTMAMTLKEGWDVVVLDSWESLISTIRYQNHVSTDAAYHRLNDIIDPLTKGDNKMGIKTSVIAIQQVTKNGKARGSNTMLHDFSTLVELRLEDEKDMFSERFITCVKNRYGANLRLYYDLWDGGDVEYDGERLMKDIELAKEIRANRKNQQAVKAEVDGLYKN